MLGIWLALMPLVVVQSWRGRKKRRGFPWYVMVLLVVCVSGTLTACLPPGGGAPTQTCTPSPIPPPPTPEPPTPTPAPCDEKPSNPRLAVLINQNPHVGFGVWDADRPDDRAWYMMLGELSRDPFEKGALIEGVADVQDGVGSLEFVQNVKGKITWGFADETSGGVHRAWGLDGGNPYLGESFPCESGTPCIANMGDSPASRLDGYENQYGAKVITYSRLDEFRTYLMWCPLPGIQCPLLVVEWSWTGTAWAVGEDSWQLTDHWTDPAVGEMKWGEPTEDMPVLTEPVLDDGWGEPLKQIEP
jgi:hypothetical protein